MGRGAPLGDCPVDHGALTLRQLAERLSYLEVRCTRCERRGWLRLACLVAEHGADLPGPELRAILAADRLRRSAALAERCDVYFPNVATVF